MNESIRSMMHYIIKDVGAFSSSQIKSLELQSIDDVRAQKPLIAFSPPVSDQMHKLKSFSREYIYRHPKISQMSSTAEQTIEKLVNYFMHDIHRIPQDFMKNHDAPPARIIADYIAGMTDRFALQIAKDMH